MRASLKCMETGDKDKCEVFIEEYKTCRKQEQVSDHYTAAMRRLEAQVREYPLTDVRTFADSWCLQERIRAARNPSGGFKW